MPSHAQESTSVLQHVCVWPWKVCLWLGFMTGGGVISLDGVETRQFSDEPKLTFGSSRRERCLSNWTFACSLSSMGAH